MISTDFPEDIFLPKKNKQSSYAYKVRKGADICKSKKILFCSICRNVGDVLERNILCLNRIAKGFLDYHMFFYENDSTDNTIEILEKYKSDKLNYISEQREDKNYRELVENGEDPWHFNRCKVLAECRNKYLEYAKNFRDFDYLCIFDADLKGGWSYDGINHGIFTLELDSQAACVSSYGVLTEHTNETALEDLDQKDYLMYDSFAFRPLKSKPRHMFALQAYNFITFSRGDEPTIVESNFGGMAIYKMESIIGCQYGAKEWQTGFVDPDHVIFNRQISGNIILDPSMISSYSHHRFSKYD
jgi:hypothetical protein